MCAHGTRTQSAVRSMHTMHSWSVDCGGDGSVPELGAGAEFSVAPAVKYTTIRHYAILIESVVREK